MQMQDEWLTFNTNTFESRSPVNMAVLSTAQSRSQLTIGWESSLHCLFVCLYRNIPALPMFVQKVVWEHRHAYSLTYHLSCFHTDNQKLPSPSYLLLSPIQNTQCRLRASSCGLASDSSGQLAKDWHSKALPQVLWPGRSGEELREPAFYKARWIDKPHSPRSHRCFYMFINWHNRKGCLFKVKKNIKLETSCLFPY